MGKKGDDHAATAFLSAGDYIIGCVGRVLTNYLSITDTQGLDTRRPVQKPSQAVQKGLTFHPPNPRRPKTRRSAGKGRSFRLEPISKSICEDGRL
jgi:hypothetical protein